MTIVYLIIKEKDEVVKTGESTVDRLPSLIASLKDGETLRVLYTDGRVTNHSK